MSATEQLRQADVRIIYQWIPSHVGIHGNEVADELANAGRLQPQPTVPATLAHVSSLLRGKTAKRWRAAIEGNDDSRLAKLYEARRADDYCAHLPRGDAAQVFRMRVNHVLLLASMSKEGGVNPRLVVCAKTESRTSTTYCSIAQHWRTAEVLAGGVRTEARSSGLSDPCSWKRRS